EIHLSWFARTFRSAQPIAGGSFERLSPPASRKNQSRRSALSVHLGHGRNHVLPFHRADVHRRALDVLLPSDKDSGFRGHSLSRARRAVRKTSPQHASLGRASDGDHDLAAHVQGGADWIL